MNTTTRSPLVLVLWFFVALLRSSTCALEGEEAVRLQQELLQTPDPIALGKVHEVEAGDLNPIATIKPSSMGATDEHDVTSCSNVARKPGTRRLQLRGGWPGRRSLSVWDNVVNLFQELFGGCLPTTNTPGSGRLPTIHSDRSFDEYENNPRSTIRDQSTIAEPTMEVSLDLTDSSGSEAFGSLRSFYLAQMEIFVEARAAAEADAELSENERKSQESQARREPQKEVKQEQAVGTLSNLPHFKSPAAPPAENHETPVGSYELVSESPLQSELIFDDEDSEHLINEAALTSSWDRQTRLNAVEELIFTLEEDGD